MDINIANYETFFLLYADNELDAAGKRQVENFIVQYPALQAELSTILSARFSPDPRIVFPDHALLLHPEKERRIIPIFWFRAAAVLILLLLSGMSYRMWHRAVGQQHETVAIQKIISASPLVSIQEKPSQTPSDKILPAATTVAVHQRRARTNKDQKNLVSPSKIRIKEDAEEPYDEPTLAATRQLPSIDRSTSSAPVTENVLEADDGQAPATAEKNDTKTAAVQITDTHPDAEGTDNAINVFAVNKKNSALSGLLNRASRLTRSTDRSVAKDAGVRVSLFQINLK